jgi:hypothetical protein
MRCHLLARFRPWRCPCQCEVLNINPYRIMTSDTVTPELQSGNFVKLQHQMNRTVLIGQTPSKEIASSPCHLHRPPSSQQPPLPHRLGSKYAALYSASSPISREFAPSPSGMTCFSANSYTHFANSTRMTATCTGCVASRSTGGTGAMSF